MILQLESINFIKVGSRVFYIQDNKVQTGTIKAIRIIINDSTCNIFYTIKQDRQQHWDEKPLIDVIGNLVAKTREDLVSRL